MFARCFFQYDRDVDIWASKIEKSGTEKILEPETETEYLNRFFSFKRWCSCSIQSRQSLKDFTVAL